jgi:hypothetical protein
MMDNYFPRMRRVARIPDIRLHIRGGEGEGEGKGRGEGGRDVADRGRKEGTEEQKKRVPKVPKKVRGRGKR